MDEPRRLPGEIRFAILGTVLALTALPLLAFLVLDFDGAGITAFIIVLLVAIYVASGVISAQERVTSIEITAAGVPPVGRTRLLRGQGFGGVMVVVLPFDW